MKRTVYIVLALVLCVALLALLLLLIQPVGDIPGRGISYAEVSRDDPACTGNICLLEYMIVSNGYLFKKVIYPDDSRDIRLRFVSPESALDVIGDVKELHKPDTQFEEDRAQYHVYSFTDRFERSFLPLDDATARRMEQLSEELYEKSNPSDGLFIQFVFWRVGGPIKDYHIFGDGAIVYSEF
ncbi:MAG: hypothetical protein JXB14_06615, partial [Candidatus Altiarchaeota archaeon]|nr:hypothetical protein [Candidatus Altiarchaeota archaeon]